MKKSVLIVILALMVTVFWGCKGQELNSIWAEKAIAIDGDYVDWEGIDLKYFEDMNIA